MSLKRKLYKLAIKYIGWCNQEWEMPRVIYTLDKLTYRDNGKAYLYYGDEEEWKHFAEYEILDLAIQKLNEYEEKEEIMRKEIMDKRELELLPGTLVKHFKRETVDPNTAEYVYRIKDIAEHTETGEKLFIYQALYKNDKGVDYGTYARPYKMFMSEVDSKKYPEIKQKYRFEKLSLEEIEQIYDLILEFVDEDMALK